jgi:hypothetical protein
MTTNGWYSLNVREETKSQIDLIAEEEDMAKADVVHQAVGFVFEDFYEPEEGPEVQVPEDRKEQFTETDTKHYSRPEEYL